MFLVCHQAHHTPLAWVKDLVGGRRPGSGAAVISAAGQGPRDGDGEA